MASPEELAEHERIVSEAKEVGQRMDATLPFKKGGWLMRFLGAYQSTAPAIVESETPGIFTRRWLQRQSTKTPDESPVRMIEDRVNVNPARKSQADQMGIETRVVAIYDPVDESLQIPEPLGLPQSEAAKRVAEIGTFVTAIGEAQLRVELKQAPTITPHPAAI